MPDPIAMNDIDRCDRCGGAGQRVEYRNVGRLPNGSPFADYREGACFECGGAGKLSIVKSLARALHRGNTLAWCMVHAQDGDPLPEQWGLGVHHGPIIAVMRGYGYGTINDGYFAEVRPPTLEEILAWDKSRRDPSR